MDQRQILLNALQKLGNGSAFLWLIFVLTVTPPMFNGMHSMAYIFVADVPSHWCSVPDLTAASWTDEQIRNISSATSCTKYNYNYTLFAKIGFDRSLMYKRENRLPDTSECSEWTFANDIERTSIVQDWNLVCNKAAARTNTQVALSFGKLLGSAFFGIFADKFGRKPSYVIGVFLLIISGPTSAFIPWYWGYMLMRFFTGVSHAAIQSPSSTTLTEVASEKHRPWMGVACNIGYPVGTLTMVGIAYYFNEWRQIQLASTLPALFLLICVWLMPESPRWLISQHRYEEAKKLIVKSHGPIDYDGLKLSEPVKGTCESIPVSKSPTMHEEDNGFSHTLDNLKNMFSHYELRRRVLITYFCWMTASLSYYALALNAANFSANRYIYTLIMAITEIPAYLVPSPIMMIMGRRQAGVLLYFIAAICLLSILIIPVAKTTLIIIVAMTGRFALSSVFGVIILYTSELFPTVLRNTAVGTSGAIGHVGSVTAPYVADLLGAAVWWGPSTLCGVLALISGLLCLILPETRGRTLADTIEEEVSGKRGSVSLRNCCTF